MNNSVDNRQLWIKSRGGCPHAEAAAFLGEQGLTGASWTQHRDAQACIIPALVNLKHLLQAPKKT